MRDNCLSFRRATTAARINMSDAKREQLRATMIYEGFEEKLDL